MGGLDGLNPVLTGDHPQAGTAIPQDVDRAEVVRTEDGAPVTGAEAGVGVGRVDQGHALSRSVGRSKPRWTITDPVTGRTFPIIAGVAGDDDPPGPDDDDNEPTGDEGNNDDPDVVTREEHEQVLERMRAADRNRSEAETRAEEVEAELQQSRIELAVHREAAKRAADGHGFADLDVVMKVLDLDSIATDDDGQPVEVGAALDHLADRHPYLLTEHASTTTDDDRTDPSRMVPSGRSANTDKQRGGGIDRKKLESKFPQLRRSRGGQRWP